MLTMAGCEDCKKVRCVIGPINAGDIRHITPEKAAGLQKASELLKAKYYTVQIIPVKECDSPDDFDPKKP